MPPPYKVPPGHLRVRNRSIFSLLLCFSSTDCGCNQCFHLLPVSCHYYRVHVQKLCLCVICCCRVKKNKKKCVLCYRIHIEFACSEAFFKSAIVIYSDFRIIFPFNDGRRMCSILFFYYIQQLFSYDYPGLYSYLH